MGAFGQSPMTPQQDGCYCWFWELWLRSVKIREKPVAGLPSTLSFAATLSILFPHLAYSEVEGAGSDRIGGGNEDYTVARPSKVFGQRLVTDPGRGIITNQFEHVSDRRYLWRH
jgi:hypothetical protein